MTSLRKVAANRRNAQRSTGPKTAAGKARSAQNAQRSTGPKTVAGKARSARNARSHGLLTSIYGEAGMDRAIEDLTQVIVEGLRRRARRGAAIRVAAAHMEMLRARKARNSLLASELAPDELASRLAAVDRYEQEARSRRNSAIRLLEGYANFPGTKPTQPSAAVAGFSRNEPNPPGEEERSGFSRNEPNP